MKAAIRRCEDALRLLAAHLDGELDAGSDREIEHHLAMCRSCYSRAEFERQLKERLGALRSEEVRPQLSERVRKIIRQFAVASAE